MLQLWYLSCKATLTLKVIHVEDIIPRCLATCVLPCHLAGYMIITHYTPSLSYTSSMWLSMWQLKCWDRRQQKVLHTATQVAVQTVLSISQRESPWQKQTSPTGDREFHPRAEKLNFHEVALSLCISLSRHCSQVLSPLLLLHIFMVARCMLFATGVFSCSGHTLWSREL